MFSWGEQNDVEDMDLIHMMQWGLCLICIPICLHILDVSLLLIWNPHRATNLVWQLHKLKCGVDNSIQYID